MQISRHYYNPTPAQQDEVRQQQLLLKARRDARRLRLRISVNTDALTRALQGLANLLTKGGSDA